MEPIFRKKNNLNCLWVIINFRILFKPNSAFVETKVNEVTTTQFVAGKSTEVNLLTMKRKSSSSRKRTMSSLEPDPATPQPAQKRL